MANKVETRTFRSGSLRAMSEGDEGNMVISGRALSYGVLSSDLGGFFERLQRGCFTRSLNSGQDVLCRREHQTGFLLGRTKNGTLQLNDGPDGLDFRCAIDPKDPIAVSTHAAIRSGLIDSMSFAFTVDGDDGDSFDSSTDEKGQPIVRRTIKRALLADVAPVAAPAYPQGTSVSARAADYSVLASVPRTVNEDRANRQRLVDIGKQLDADEIRACFAAGGGVICDYGTLTVAADWRPAFAKRSLEIVLDAGPEATIAELNRRAGVAFEAEPMRSGLNAQPGSTPDTDDFDPSASSSPDDHRRAAEYHRAIARKAKTLDAGVAHFKAADAHDKAAQTNDALDSSMARGASRNLAAAMKKALKAGDLT